MIFRLNRKSKTFLCVFSSLFFLSTNTVANAALINVDLGGLVEVNTNVEKDTNDKTSDNVTKEQNNNSADTAVVNSYEQDNPLIKYYGKWQSDNTIFNSNRTSTFSDSSDSYATFAFTGTEISLYGYMSNSKGYATVNVDGQDYDIDTYSSIPKRVNKYFHLDNLANGKHIVKISVKHQKNPSSYGYYVNLDKIEVKGGELVKLFDSKNYEENNSLIKYSGNWTKDDSDQNSGGSAIYSDSSDAYATFEFTGTGLSLYGYRSNSKGYATITIDGKDYNVDTYSQAPKRQDKFFEISDLENTKHVAKIKVAKNKNANSYGYYVSLDKIEVHDGELVKQIEKNSYEENNPLITYTGAWTQDKNEQNSGSSAIYSDSSDSSASFSFTGTGISLYGYGSNSKGYVKVNIDGRDYSVDTYKAAPERQSKFFNIENLENKKHNVKITVLHEKNPSSYGYYVSLDKIDITEGKLVEPYETKSYEESNPLIKYYGDWTKDESADDSGNTSIHSDSSDAYMTFAFTGTGLSLSGYRNNSKGFATINIDGVDHVVDTYLEGPLHQAEFFKIDNLDNTKHIVKVKVTHQKNDASYGYYVNLDKIDIHDGELVNCYDIKSYEENNSLVKYYGNWITDKDDQNSGGTSTYSNDANASAVFAFTGTGFSLSGYRNNSKGIATINIDGKDYTIDTYSKYPKRQSEFFDIDNLSNTKHVVKISVAHEKNDNSYGYYVNLDKIDIHDGQLVKRYESNTYEQDHPYIDYFGNWTTDNNPLNSNGTAKFSGNINACITFQFKGTGFAWYGYANNSKGIANIYIDDVKIPYDTYLNGLDYQHLVFEKENLADTNHIVRIEVSGLKSSQSFGPYINLDKLEIYEGELVPICPEISVYQDNNLRLIYNGEWSKEINSQNSNQSAKYSGNAGDYVTFAFNGTGFKWYEYANNSKGIAKIYIDDKAPILIDTYNSEAKYQYPIFEINNLESTRHVVKIEVTGDQNPASFGKYINIDRIDIFNGIMKSVYPSNFYEENHNLIKYNGTWDSDTNSLNSNSSSTFSNSKGNSFTFKFNGNGFRWYGYANNAKGIAKIYIDGKELSKDTYQSYMEYQYPFFETLFNEKGKHTVTVEVTGNGNPDAYGSYINLDNIEIFNGELLPYDAITTYEESNPLINFKGNWANDAISKSSNTPGDSISFDFKGTGFVWYGYANNSKGIAEVYIDGMKVATVDGYSNAQELQKPFYKVDSLADTVHTVEIKVTDQKDPKSYGYYVNIDKLDIYDGELLDLN